MPALLNTNRDYFLILAHYSTTLAAILGLVDLLAAHSTFSVWICALIAAGWIWFQRTSLQSTQGNRETREYDF